jgi:hypothetical protein
MQSRFARRAEQLGGYRTSTGAQRRLQRVTGNGRTRARTASRKPDDDHRPDADGEPVAVVSSRDWQFATLGAAGINDLGWRERVNAVAIPAIKRVQSKFKTHLHSMVRGCQYGFWYAGWQL